MEGAFLVLLVLAISILSKPQTHGERLSKVADHTSNASHIDFGFLVVSFCGVRMVTKD